MFAHFVNFQTKLLWDFEKGPFYMNEASFEDIYELLLHRSASTLHFRTNFRRVTITWSSFSWSIASRKDSNSMVFCSVDKMSFSPLGGLLLPLRTLTLLVEATGVLTFVDVDGSWNQKLRYRSIQFDESSLRNSKLDNIGLWYFYLKGYISQLK